MPYTPDQEKDIKEREVKAIAALKELQFTPAAQVFKTNLGDDVFADRVVPYLQDTKYNGKQEVKTSAPTEAPKPTNEATPKA